MKLPRLRFSLRTLVIAVLLVGSATTLWVNRKPFVVSVVCSGSPPDQKPAATGRRISMDNGMVQVRSASTAKIIAAGPRLDLVRVELSCDGEYVFSSNGQMGAIYKVASGTLEKVAALSDADARIYSGVFSDDGKRIVTYPMPTETPAFIDVWDVESGKNLGKKNIPVYEPRWVGRNLLLVHGKAELWDDSLSRQVAEVSISDSGFWVHTLMRLGPDEYVAFGITGDGIHEAVVLGVSSDMLSVSRKVCFDRFLPVACNRDHTVFIGYYLDGERRQCDAAPMGVAGTDGRLAQSFGPADLEFCPDGQRIITRERRGEYTIWEQRRPPERWGIAWRPELWLTLLFGVGLVWSVWRDRRWRGWRAAAPSHEANLS